MSSSIFSLPQTGAWGPHSCFLECVLGSSSIWKDKAFHSENGLRRGGSEGGPGAGLEPWVWGWNLPEAAALLCFPLLPSVGKKTCFFWVRQLKFLPTAFQVRSPVSVYLLAPNSFQRYFFYPLIKAPGAVSWAPVFRLVSVFRQSIRGWTFALTALKCLSEGRAFSESNVCWTRCCMVGWFYFFLWQHLPSKAWFSTVKYRERYCFGIFPTAFRMKYNVKRIILLGRPSGPTIRHALPGLLSCVLQHHIHLQGWGLLHSWADCSGASQISL